ncbi:hypothetical protein [Terracoccus luteus]|uniref:Sortase family protein n=1 Tax=Terracoccus luteus TaxID=53356 RepID=A0A839PTL1_9MICO|nr:hypothetical protein [Terracoccus luteus]MBB2986499.1 hypothetical protein [Terracoccus luteus]MCP2171912.1 hypothetical protein [Terracoccus luteus]
MAAAVAGRGRSPATRHPASGIRVSRDLDGNRVEWEAEPDLGEADVTPTGGRFELPRLGLDVPMLATSVVDGVVTPPTFTDAFVVRQYGTVEDAGSGLVVVAVHAVRGGRGPGNALLDLPADPTAPSPPKVRAGDLLVADGVDYVVTAMATEPKGSAANDPRIWANWRSRGDELVVLTCLLSPSVPMSEQDNLVVFARRA